MFCFSLNECAEIHNFVQLDCKRSFLVSAVVPSLAASPCRNERSVNTSDARGTGSHFGVNTKGDKSSMNDSSKRLRDHPQAEVDEEWEPVTYGENPGKSIMCERVIPKGMMEQPPIAPTMAWQAGFPTARSDRHRRLG